MSESVKIIRQQLKEKQTVLILSMKPGRELDALVGRYVMGFQIEKWNADPEDPIDYWYRSNTGLHPEDEEVERVPNYSTVLFSAEKILPKFQHWLIQSDSDGKGVTAAFSVNGEAGTQVKACSSMPEAICKAALIALVDNNKLIDQLLNE